MAVVRPKPPQILDRGSGRIYIYVSPTIVWCLGNMIFLVLASTVQDRPHWKLVD
jgi:hypothetical protein